MHERGKDKRRRAQTKPKEGKKPSFHPANDLKVEPVNGTLAGPFGLPKTERQRRQQLQSEFRRGRFWVKSLSDTLMPTPTSHTTGRADLIASEMC